MTQSLGMNAAGDIYINAAGSLQIDTGPQAVTDACKNVSLMQLGEAIYQTNLGMPTFQTVFNGTPNVAIYEAYLRTALENVEGVVNVTSLMATVDHNVFSYQAQIETIYGNLFLNQ